MVPAPSNIPATQPGGIFWRFQDLTEAVRQDADAKPVCCHATGERRHLYSDDRRSGHLSDEKVGNHGARRLEHTAQPIRIAMQRQRLAEWPQGIEELLPVGIGENDVVPIDGPQGYTGQIVKFRKLASLQVR